jgi:VanZ family protein
MAGARTRVEGVVRGVSVSLAIVWIAAVIYISLRPFTFTEATWADTFAEFMDFTFRRRIRLIDVARNVIALVPLGWFLAAAAAPDGRRDDAVRRGLRIVAAVTALSASLEIAQAFVRVRVVSGRDVAAQALGCASGVVAWTLAGGRVVKSIERRLMGSPGDHRVRQP